MGERARRHIRCGIPPANDKAAVPICPQAALAFGCGLAHPLVVNWTRGGMPLKDLLIPMAILAMAAFFCYILYRKGRFVVQAKSALFYVEAPRVGGRRNGIAARFASCNGVVIRVIRLSPSKQYRFVFSSNLTKGTVCVEIYGKHKARLARFPGEQPCALIPAKGGTIYQVVTKFVKADGEYTLRWDEI